MGRARKEPLSDEELKIAEEWDKKISDVRKRKEMALKKCAEKQSRERQKLADKVINALYEICGEAVDGEMVGKFIDYMKNHSDEIRGNIKPYSHEGNVIIGLEEDKEENE